MAHVRFLRDRYIAANQGQENSVLGNDYELEAIADAFVSWTPLLCNYAGGKVPIKYRPVKVLLADRLPSDQENITYIIVKKRIY